MLTNALFNGTLTIQDDPDLQTANTGNLITTGTIKTGTSAQIGTFLSVLQYLSCGTYVQAANCNFTSTTTTNTFTGPVSLLTTAPLTSASTASFTILNTTSTTGSNLFAGPLTVQASITGTNNLTITNQASCANITTTSSSALNTIAGLLSTNLGIIGNLSTDATSAGNGTKGALSAGLTNVGGFSNYLSAYFGGRIVLSTIAASVNSNYITPNSNTGAFFHCTGQTWIDTITASGASAAGNFNGAYFGIPTLNATNTNVTTPTASTVTIAGAPTTNTNQTIANPYSLFVQNGNTLLGGTADANMTNTAIAALNISGGLAVAKSVSATNFYLTSYNLVNNTTSISSGNANIVQYLMTPNLASTARTEVWIGQNGSVNNCGIINFTYNANNSTANMFGLGLYGSNNRLTINGAGQVAVATTTNATSATTGSFVLAGGGGVAQDWYVGGTFYPNKINITSTVNSTSVTTGAIIAQSAGFAQDVYMNNAHSITRNYITGYVNSNQNATYNSNVALAVAISIISSSGSDMSSALVSGNGTTVQFTAPYRSNYMLALTLLVTPSAAGNCRLWTQITSNGIYSGTVRRGYVSRALAGGTQENLTTHYLGPLNAGDTVQWYVYLQPTGLISVGPSLNIAASTYSSLDISFDLRND